MPEVLWVMGMLLALGALGAVRLVAWSTLLSAGYDLMLDSASVGIPTELVYYVALPLALRHSGSLPRGWYWRPFEHHHRLSRLQKAMVLPWFFTGAVGFLGIVLGIGIAVLGMIAAVVQTR
jgi:hypothetical protein